MLFLYGQWLKLPLTTRAQIASQFGIIKRGSTEVFENRVVNDGYVIGEIEAALNIDALQKNLGSDLTDMAVLWDMMVCKAEGREYLASKAEQLMSEVVDAVIATVPTKPPFCDSCTSRGVRHKKECPKYVPTR